MACCSVARVMLRSTGMKTNTATPAKLRDGSWGARVASAVSVGEVITITTRAGRTWDARVTRVLWSGEGVTLVATSSAPVAGAAPAAAPAAPRYGATSSPHGCSCDCSDCSPRCHCSHDCVCRGGNISDC